jgi:hypothetical protein
LRLSDHIRFDQICHIPQRAAYVAKRKPTKKLWCDGY